MTIPAGARALACLLSVALVASPMPARASISEEMRMGEEFMVEARRHLPLIHDWELVGFINDIGARLVATLGEQPFRYEFNVVISDDLNAFAVPGGKLFVHTGLIARVDNEDELAGVLGHEVAHAHAHHIVRQQQKAAAANYTSLLGLLLSVIHPALGIGALSAGQAWALKYQRDFEREADYLGIDYARKAGFDQAGIMFLLRKIWDEQNIYQSQIPPYFLSHPLTAERLANIEAVLGRNEFDASVIPASHRLLRAAAIARANGQTRAQCVPEYERRLAEADEAGRPLALELLGILMAHGEDWGAAEPHLEQARAAGRTVDRELGRVYLRRGKLQEARPLLEAAVAREPGDWDAMADLGTLEMQQGNLDRAVDLLEKSVELEAWRPEVLRTLGRTEGKARREGKGFYYFARAAEAQGDLEGALTYYQRALEKLEPEDELRKDIDVRLGKVREEVGRQIPIPGRFGGLHLSTRPPRPGRAGATATDTDGHLDAARWRMRAGVRP